MSEELRKTIMDAMRSVSERADEFKAGCATFDGEWPDAEDKAIYDAEVALVERLRVALAAISDAAQPDERAPCVHADNPKACYRVRCQLGNKCVDDNMSPRATAPQATVKGDAPTGFDISLASVDAYDPQSFTNGAKWMQARAAAPQAGAPNDAAITACALMIKGICMTLPQDQWSRKIEERIRFMLATPQAEK